MRKYPTMEFWLDLGFLLVTFSTPDFNIETPELRPRLLPRLSRDDWGDVSEYRYFVTLTWFFHLSACYGRPAAKPVPSEDECLF